MGCNAYAPLTYLERTLYSIASAPPGCLSNGNGTGTVRAGIDTGANFCIDCHAVGLSTEEVPCMTPDINGTRYYLLGGNPQVTYLPAGILPVLNISVNQNLNAFEPTTVIGAVDFSGAGFDFVDRRLLIEAFSVIPLSSAMIIRLTLDGLALPYGIGSNSLAGLITYNFSMRGTRFSGPDAIIASDAFRGFRCTNLFVASDMVFEGGATIEGWGFARMGLGTFASIDFSNLTMSGYTNISGLPQPVGLTSGIFQGVVALFMNMSGLRLIGGASMATAAFSGLVLGVGLSLRGSVIENWYSNNFSFCTRTLAVGEGRNDYLCMQDAVWPFTELLVAGVLDLSYSRFPNNALPPGVFTGVFLSESNAYTPDGYIRTMGQFDEAEYVTHNSSQEAFLQRLVAPIVNLSHCELERITDASAVDFHFANGSAVPDFNIGPFEGTTAWPCKSADYLGTTASVVDLSFNRITRVYRGDLSGVTMCEVNLDHNPIYTFQAGWASPMVTQDLSVHALGSPSQCQTFTDRGTSQSENVSALSSGRTLTTTTIECQCAAGTLGTGGFCDMLPCGASSAAVLSNAINHGTVPIHAVDSGKLLHVSCDPGWFNPSVSSVKCMGGLYSVTHAPSCQDQTYIPVVITLLCMVILTSGWLNKNYLLHDELCAPFPRTIKGLAFELLVAVLIFLPGMNIYMANRYKRKIREQSDEIEMKQLLLGQREEELESIRDSWRIEYHDLLIEGEIGRGAAGIVSVATWLGNRVAVKEIVSEADILEASFSKEAEAMQSLRHPNILSFYGAGMTPRNAPFVVMEYAEYGSLFSLLNERNDDFNWAHRRRFAADIVAGMTYLHGRNPPMMHRDLKADNCLVGNGFFVKVADFGTILKQKRDTSRGSSGKSRRGLTRSFKGSFKKSPPAELTLTATLGTGTPLWMAPEVLVGKHGAAHYGPKIDVYSFGIVMFEITTGLLPFEEVTNFFELERLVADGVRPTLPPGIQPPSGWIELMKSCWAHDPSKRPDFRSIAVTLSMMEVEHGEVPIESRHNTVA